MDLYLFYLGGNAGQSNLEVHDIQFVAASSAEEAWPALRQAWFGDADKLHIDGYRKLNAADGYRISLSRTPLAQAHKLFFVNVGAYHPQQLAELHAFGLFVAEQAQTAKQRALRSLLPGTAQQHKDNLKDVDNCLLLDKVGDWYIQLTPDASCQTDLTPDWQGYQPIGG